ncbi:helix-turn-helix domain-containing protein [Mangrovivirga cuniculi]|uniref:helix-turn-helix domain-containing protein n=1 Tax=Mangrovivirga cuniculi TaxID=2715131 RepID=UPI0015860DA3|nr:helix-turn-helix transcriptional regulator [Mangrovivirga cuniculi]
MDLSKIIGRQIASYRKQKKISQEKLADLSDLHPDYIGKIERGERNPSIISILNILDVLQVPYGEFFSQIEK